MNRLFGVVLTPGSLRRMIDGTRRCQPAIGRASRRSNAQGLLVGLWLYKLNSGERL